MATATPSKATDSSAPAKVPPLGRVMTWIGLAAGTAITVLAVLHGIRIPGLQVVLSVLVTWLLLIVLAVTVAELARRHHRAAARHAWRHSKRGARFARHHTGRGARWLTARAADRWQRRQRRPPASDPPPPYVTAGPMPASGPPAADPGAGTSPQGRTSTMTDTKVVDDGHYDLPAAQARAASQRPGSRIRPARRAQHTATKAGGAMPAEWGGVIARAADFEPDDDGELLGWMGDEVSGVAGYAEALVDLYESCTAGIGLDPVAMTALHDVADAAAHAAETMSGARHRFADHYELPREFAANGGLMTHDGRWVTGDGDA